MTNRLAVQHGKADARTFAAECPEATAQALAQGQLGPDEALINALGVDEVARLFGLKRGGTRAFDAACGTYNTAYLDELRRLAAHRD